MASEILSETSKHIAHIILILQYFCCNITIFLKADTIAITFTIAIAIL